jgi:hypothetical protein
MTDNLILLKNRPFILRGLRARPEFIEGTNGGAVEIIGDFPFMLSLVEACIGFFSRNTNCHHRSLGSGSCGK